MCLGLNFSFLVFAFKSWIGCSAVSASFFSYEVSVMKVCMKHRKCFLYTWYIGSM